MKDFEHKDYFNSRFCFCGDENKVVTILDTYAQNQIDLTDINKVFELYHTKLFFDNVCNISGWTDEKYNKYKNLTNEFTTLIYEKVFKNLTEDNILDKYENCYVTYWDDFRNLFYMFKTYKRISKTKFPEIVYGLRWSPFHILEDKDFVNYFDVEISQVLENPEYGVRFVISYYLEKQEKKQKIYIPKNFTVDKRIKLINDYLQGKPVNPNYLQLIIHAKNTKELPITPKMRKQADNRNNEFWENNKSAQFQKYGFCVSFGSYDKEKNFRNDNGNWIFEYGTEWIKKNTDYPTVLNNFIYIFEYVDIQMRCSCVSHRNNRSVFSNLFAIKGNGMFDKSVAFDMLDHLSDAQMAGYVRELSKYNIVIENVIKWFFEDYLLNEFKIQNYVCNMPKASDSLLSKCKTIASAIDGVLNRYKIYCDDGEIDEDLFQYITDSPRIKDVPSLIKNKYCYVVSDDILKEMNLIFSSQSMLGYTERTKSKYSTFLDLILNENMKVSELFSYNQDAIKWLIDRGTIFIENEIIKFNKERVAILKDFYENDVISLQHTRFPLLKEMINNGDVVTDNKLLTKPEYQYFDYLLNNAEFSDGKAIRNKYTHDAIIVDENIMSNDYNTMLKIMIMLIIKINDDCCLSEKINKEGDFYEL